MIPAVLAVLFFAAAFFFLHAAFIRPLRPLPAEIDGIYVLIPAMACLFGGVAAMAMALGATWKDIEAAISLVISNMFSIV